MREFFDGTQVYNSGTVNLSDQAYYLFVQLQVAGASTSGWHTVPTPSSPGGSMDIAEVQIYS
jgi:hypothetical protein